MGCLEWGGRFLRKIWKVVLPEGAGSPLRACALLAGGEARTPRKSRTRPNWSPPPAPRSPLPVIPSRESAATAGSAAHRTSRHSRDTTCQRDTQFANYYLPHRSHLEGDQQIAREQRATTAAENPWARAAYPGHIVCQCILSVIRVVYGLSCSGLGWNTVPSLVVWTAATSSLVSLSRFPTISRVLPYPPRFKHPTVNRGRVQFSLTTTYVFPGCSLSFQERSVI